MERHHVALAAPPHPSANNRNLEEEIRNEIDEENKRCLERMKQELKEAIKIEFSQRGSQYTPLVEADIQVLGARVSTKGSNAEIAVKPSGKEDGVHVIPSMGLYVQDDAVRVNVEIFFDSDAQVPFPTSEIQYDSHISQKKLAEAIAPDDPLRGLIKSLYDIYEKPVELLWDGTKFGIPNVDASLFLTYADVNDIIAGDKCLNIVILYLWMMFMDEWSSSLGHDSMYGFLEPQSIHNAKDRRAECQHYIETWDIVVWFSSLHKKLDIHIKAAINKVMFKAEAMSVAKHWMWNIVTGGLKNDWTMWFGDGTPLDIETMTTIRKKWTAYFIKLKNIQCRKL
ncbi:hypothetical protein GmHk_18G051575 [Glycine max]|nr:hypothetical protein GmHk_18G051575 [Glycine max]